jgi:transcriptional regulator with XRE-family HTH domain
MDSVEIREIPDRLRRKLVAAEGSRALVARLAGCSYSLIHKICSGDRRNITTDTAARIAEALEQIEGAEEYPPASGR